MSSLLRLELEGLPPSVNQMYRTGKYGNRYKRTEVEDWQRETANAVRQAWNKPRPYMEEVEVRVIFRVKDKRRWDVDNRLKALFDCLEDGGAIKDDSQIFGVIAARVQGEDSATWGLSSKLCMRFLLCHFGKTICVSHVKVA